MEGVFFALAMVALAVVAHWCVTNDDKDLFGKTVGVLAMRDPEPDAQVDAKGNQGGKPKPAPRRRR